MSKKDVKIEKGVGRPPASRPGNGRQMSERNRRYRDGMKRLEPGESFFIEGVAPKELQFLRPLAASANIKISILAVEEDEIYGLPGTRVYRNADEEEDDL
ncbi:hypothetical protein [Pseudomonas phage UF_RH7]|nr:hypothetical protein [Pseudomonas phage UF_RH7]